MRETILFSSSFYFRFFKNFVLLHSPPQPLRTHSFFRTDNSVCSKKVVRE